VTTTDTVASRRRGSGGTSESPTPPEEVIQTSFRLPRSRWTKLQQLSIEERLTVQSIIVSALEKEFESRGKKF
jgi:hypothetical protein